MLPEKNSAYVQVYREVVAQESKLFKVFYVYLAKVAEYSPKSRSTDALWMMPYLFLSMYFSCGQFWLY